MSVYGIIGGIGSYAGVDIVRRLNAIVTEENQGAADSDFPRVIYYQIPFAGVDGQGFLEHGGIVSEIERELQAARDLLVSAGTTKVLFGCNTYGYVADEVFANDEAPSILNFLLDYAFESAVEEYDKVLLLASRRRVDAVNSDSRYAHRTLFLDDEQQSVIDGLINSTVGIGYNEPAAMNLLSIIEEADSSVDAVVIGCTELSMYHNVLKERYHKKPLLDTVEHALKTMVSSTHKADDDRGGGGRK